MSGQQIATSVTILNSYLGFQAISLTDFSLTTVSAIAAGSKVEIAGAFFTFTSDETINASSWTAIATGSTAYIALTPSGTAGSQIVTAAFTTTAPVWSVSKQGWYASASSVVRYVAGCYKAGTSSYQNKWIFEKTQEKIKPSGMLTILSSQTVIAPASVLYITGCAAGGNGASPGTTRGAGGGGAEWALKKPFYVIPGEALTITIGAVGSNTTISTSSSMFTLHCGGSAASTTSGIGGALGDGTGAGGRGGDFGGSPQYYGDGGERGLAAGGLTFGESTDGQGYGGGGGSYQSGGSAGHFGSGGGNPGYGGGGSGCASGDVADRNGGPGIIILEW